MASNAMSIETSTLWTRFEMSAKADGNAIAVIDAEGRQWTRSELMDRCDELAARLTDTSITPRTRVLVRPDRTIMTVIAALALSRLDAILCFEPPGLDRHRRGKLAHALGTVAVLGHGLEGFECAACAAPSAAADPRDSACVLIAGTSGSTGRPKFVMHGTAALDYSANACAAIAGLEPGEAIFAAIAPETPGGFALSIHMALAQGRPLVLAPRWDALDAMTRIVEHRCRWTTMVPTQLLGMVEAARDGAWDGPLPLRAIAVGGSAMSSALIADAERLLGVSALRMFGLSECLAHCSARLEDGRAGFTGSEGFPFPGTELEAFDTSGIRLPRGQRGHAGVKGPSLFLGYALGLGAGEETFTPDGFLLTGDEIVREPDGQVRVVGRIKDQIIRGGYNIDPAELEAVIALHPDVAEVAVVPVSDPRLGEKACAVIRLRPEAQALSLMDVCDLLAKAGVYRRKWPEALVITGRLPRLAGGKIDRRRIAASASKSLTGA